jgi:flagellar hook-associated protein 3 FlgL
VTAANNQFRVTILSATQAQISNVGTAAVLDTVNFTSGTPFLFNGLEFDIEGTTGNTVDFQLATPKKQNIAETLNNFVTALSDSTLSDAAFNEALEDAITGADNSLSSVANGISEIGGRGNITDAVFASNLDLEIANKTARSNIEEVDYAEAISELSRQEAALQAAQATFSKVTGTSLFDFIR